MNPTLGEKRLLKIATFLRERVARKRKEQYRGVTPVA